MKIGSLNISVENILPREGLDPFDLAIVGMLIVFTGLFIISLSVYFLPKLIKLVNDLHEVYREFLSPKKKKNTREEIEMINRKNAQEKEAEELNIMMAIAVAINLENRLNSQKVTWVRREDENSSWKISGRVDQISRLGSGRR